MGLTYDPDKGRGAPKIEIYRVADGGWRWRAKGGNGEIVAAGEKYATRANAMRGISSLMAILEDVDLKIVTLPEEPKDTPQLVPRDGGGPMVPGR